MVDSSFRNREYGGQLVDFAGLQFGKCACTDIDIACDWQGKTFVFVEVKYRGSPLTLGQKLHLEALCKGLTEGGRTAYAILAHHSTPAGSDILAAGCEVFSVFSAGRGWKRPAKSSTLLEVMTELHNDHVKRTTA